MDKAHGNERRKMYLNVQMSFLVCIFFLSQFVDAWVQLGKQVCFVAA